VTSATVQVGTFSTSATIAVAMAAGLFDRVGLAVSVEECRSSTQQLDRLREHRYDIIHTSPDNVMEARLGGSDAVIFLVIDSGLPQHLVARAGVDMDHLRAGTAGVDAPDSGYAFVLYELLAAHGLERGRDYRVEPIGSSRDRFDALVEGRVDTCLLNSTMLPRAEALGFVSLVSVSDVMPWYPGTAAATTERYAHDHPDRVAGYVSAMTAARRWSDDPANAQARDEMVARHLGISEEEARAVLASEEGARTASLPPVEQVEANLARVAGLRRQMVGTEPVGYFDRSWMTGERDAHTSR
jgi:ABC-type nitrate/sulfonate/bicarbonate transport system substrate-binding protein